MVASLSFPYPHPHPIPLYPIPPYTLYPILSSHIYDIQIRFKIYDNTAPLYPISPIPLIPLQHFTSTNLKLSKLETPNPSHPIPLYPILSSHIYDIQIRFTIYDNPNPLYLISLIPYSPIYLIPILSSHIYDIRVRFTITPTLYTLFPLYPLSPSPT